MTAEEEHVKDEHGQPERIVLLSALNSAEAFALKLRRCIGGHPDRAGKAQSAIYDLETIAVD
jgi:hypothetical protein